MVFHGGVFPLDANFSRENDTLDTLCHPLWRPLRGRGDKKWRNYPAVYSFTHQYGMTRRNFAKTFSIEKI